MQLNSQELSTIGGSCYFTDEELNVPIEKVQTYSEVMSELGSEQEVEEAG